jgi:hypothetical protein
MYSVSGQPSDWSRVPDGANQAHSTPELPSAEQLFDRIVTYTSRANGDDKRDGEFIWKGIGPLD